MKHDFKVIIFEQNIHRAVFSMPMWWLNLRIEQQILHVFNKTNVTNLQEKTSESFQSNFCFQVFDKYSLYCYCDVCNLAPMFPSRPTSTPSFFCRSVPVCHVVEHLCQKLDFFTVRCCFEDVQLESCGQ